MISAIKGANVNLDIAHGFISYMKSILHSAFPMSAEVTEDAISMYMKYGGRRKLSYFDSFHVATARRYLLEFVTSDRHLIYNAENFDIVVRVLSRTIV